jgi:phosphate transport system substrate-binding protein
VFGLSSAAASAATLSGAGSTLVAPIEAEWAAAFDSSTGDTVTYASVGSGTGYKDIAAGQVDFGASDAPLSVYSSPPCNSCVQIPWALTATGVSFHIPGISRLHLTGPVIAAIYLGQITNWNDGRIASLNRGVHLPNLKITVFWRSDGSGDTYAFTRYLSDVSGAFNSRVGSSTAVNFPVGQGARGNSGLVTAIQQTNGGIAYIAVSYLIANRMAAAAIKNAGGRYVVPNLSNIEAAASAVHHVPSNNQLTIVNPPRNAKSAYAISTFTYVIVPTNAKQGTLLKQFIGYALGQGQQFGPRLDFAPLPRAVLNAARNTLNGIS